MRLDDTIAAVATPLQPSGLGVIRVSGTEAVSLVEPLFKGRERPLKKAETHKLQYGWIHDEGELLDKVLLVVMRAPHSYTTEDVVEIQCHGSPLVLRTILDLVLRQGARLAEAGEFTQRAFLHGRLDLTQVEAVADLIHASSEVGAKLAAQQLHGKLYQAIDIVKKQVVSIASLIEAGIEFPEEGLEFTQHEDCLQRLDHACADLENMLSHAEQGRRMREGFAVALIGRPNVGKSSLLNTLLREQRAIVTTIPGTTRDSIEESVQIQGVAFRLTDTAGIRKTADLLETEGIRRTQIVRDKADLVLLILDSSEQLTEEDQTLIRDVEQERTIVVLNKKDRLSAKLPEWYEAISAMESVLISAKTGDGCDELESCLFAKATQGGLPEQDEIWITNRRQQQAAKNALAALQQAREIFENSDGEEFLAVDLRSCLNALGEIVGETTPDDLLGQIFSEFCIGK
ncbi:MAG TPA: tRNA uridine-5-carboxymethylaminomethyl(34) synthesis GTPase MnmE [Deltaproteobacteria bacterium]|nr:tRNA uridine-5-carboxymethylaminomethyl(34) synthesis GTPase MnmE [Deltaproteobacteria bacterium]